MNSWGVAVAILLIAVLGLIYRHVKSRASLTLLDEREELSNDEIYQKFYASTDLEKPIVIELWHEVADILEVPATRLRPSDKFGKDVGVYWITSEKLDELGVVAKKRAETLGKSIDLTAIDTVDAYVKTFAVPR
jgi:hypothetical protein